MTALINPNPNQIKQSNLPHAGAAIRVILFSVGNLTLGFRIEAVHKVLKQTQVHGSGVNSVGVTHMGDHELIVVDLQQRLFQSSSLTTGSKRGYLIVAQNKAGDFYAIPVATPPTLMEVPLETIRILPEPYRRADTLGIASHVAVIPQADSSLTLFLVDVDQLLVST